MLLQAGALLFTSLCRVVGSSPSDVAPRIINACCLMCVYDQTDDREVSRFHRDGAQWYGGVEVGKFGRVLVARARLAETQSMMADTARPAAVL